MIGQGYQRCVIPAIVFENVCNDRNVAVTKDNNPLRIFRKTVPRTVEIGRNARLFRPDVRSGKNTAA